MRNRFIRGFAMPRPRCGATGRNRPYSDVTRRPASTMSSLRRTSVSSRSTCPSRNSPASPPIICRWSSMFALRRSCRRGRRRRQFNANPVSEVRKVQAGIVRARELDTLTGRRPPDSIRARGQQEPHVGAGYMTANPNLAADQKSLGKQGASIDDNAILRAGALALPTGHKTERSPGRQKQYCI